MEGVLGDECSGAVARWRSDMARPFQHYLDMSAPHIIGRWMGTLRVASIYVLCVYLVGGFYIVSYCLGEYLLNLRISFLSPKVYPKLEVVDDPSLPTRGSDDFKPFICHLPEFQFRYSVTIAFIVAFVTTFFSVFDLPAYWPFLLCYWMVPFLFLMKKQILNMINYKYVPFSVGKQSYGGKRASGSSSSNIY